MRAPKRRPASMTTAPKSNAWTRVSRSRPRDVRKDLFRRARPAVAATRSAPRKAATDTVGLPDRPATLTSGAGDHDARVTFSPEGNFVRSRDLLWVGGGRSCPRRVRAEREERMHQSPAASRLDL